MSVNPGANGEVVWLWYEQDWTQTRTRVRREGDASLSKTDGRTDGRKPKENSLDRKL